MSISSAAIVTRDLSDEDALRADMYDFLASLLRKEPSDELIDKVSQLEGDETPIGSACLTLAHLAKTMDNGLIRNEYVEMFIGVGRGEILPFASYYLTGFLNDKPLANLRAEMSKIGVARVEDVKEPEPRENTTMSEIRACRLMIISPSSRRPEHVSFTLQTWISAAHFISINTSFIPFALFKRLWIKMYPYKLSHKISNWALQG